MSEKENIKEYVEDKIIKYTFWAKNFNKEDMDYVDAYCKKVYDNNRKLMILDLIRYKEENIPLILLNNKINLIYEDLHNRVSKLEIKKEEPKVEVKKKVWKGFSDK